MLYRTLSQLDCLSSLTLSHNFYSHESGGNKPRQSVAPCMYLPPPPQNKSNYTAELSSALIKFHFPKGENQRERTKELPCWAFLSYNWQLLALREQQRESWEVLSCTFSFSLTPLSSHCCPWPLLAWETLLWYGKKQECKDRHGEKVQKWRNEPRVGKKSGKRSVKNHRCGSRCWEMQGEGDTEHTPERREGEEKKRRRHGALFSYLWMTKIWMVS